MDVSLFGLSWTTKIRGYGRLGPGPASKEASPWRLASISALLGVDAEKIRVECPL
jgi:hypothetical protein